MEWIEVALSQYVAQSYWEWIAALLGIGYVLFITRENLWGWVMAFAGTAIYTVLFWEGQLPMQALLNFYYLLMAVYGFWLWRFSPQAQKSEVVISKLTGPMQLKLLAFATLFSLLAGYYLSVTEASVAPYLDAFVAIFSVVNTYLMAQKYLQSWLYWVVIDAFAILLYWQQEYYATVLLMAVYVVLAIMGYREWSRRFAQAAHQNKSDVPAT